MVPIEQPKIFLGNLSSLISDALTPINSRIRGESFMRMEHVHLEDMFGRRQKPVLDIYYEIRRDMIAGGIPGQREYYFSVVFGFKNTGKYVARFPAIRIKPQGLLIKSGDRFSMKHLIQSDQERNVNGLPFSSLKKSLK